MHYTLFSTLHSEIKMSDLEFFFNSPYACVCLCLFVCVRAVCVFLSIYSKAIINLYFKQNICFSISLKLCENFETFSKYKQIDGKETLALPIGLFNGIFTHMPLSTGTGTLGIFKSSHRLDKAGCHCYYYLKLRLSLLFRPLQLCHVDLQDF